MKLLEVYKTKTGWYDNVDISSLEMMAYGEWKCDRLVFGFVDYVYITSGEVDMLSRQYITLCDRLLS